MTPPPSSRQPEPGSTPNTAFRRIRGDLSPGEFAATVRRAAREIGERVSCDARYIGRVEAGEIRCPNYAYERVFKYMFPGSTLVEMGFTPREAVRGRGAAGARRTLRPAPGRSDGETLPDTVSGTVPDGADTAATPHDEESDVLRRAFITSGPAAALAVTLPLRPPLAAGRRGGRIGAAEARSVEEAVRHIRLLDDKHGAGGLYQRAGHVLRGAYALLEHGTHRRPVTDRLYAGSGELAISVGWLAHDSGRHDEARQHYTEALATARAAGDPALEAHAFCNTSFLARDDGRPREAVWAAQAAQRAADRLGSARLMSLLALREAGGWAVLGDRAACERALVRAHRLFARGTADHDPEWMSFFGEAELEGLEAQAWSRLGDHRRAAAHARRGVLLQDPHFTRNIALYSVELAVNLAAGGEPDEAAKAGNRVLNLLGDRVRSSRIQAILAGAADALSRYRDQPAVAEFLSRYARSPGTEPGTPGAADG